MNAQPASTTAPHHPGAFSLCDLVQWHGHIGKVCGFTNTGLVEVSFGRGRKRALSESSLSVFVPWYSDRD